MAFASVGSQSPQTQHLSTGEASPSPAKRPRQFYHRHHNIHAKAQRLPLGEPAFLQQETFDRLFIGSIKAICEEQALRNDIYDPIIESIALEAFRNLAEEFFLRLCTTVRRSMLAARRTYPIATDFEPVAQALDRQIPKGELLAYRTKPEVNPSLLPTPPPEDSFHDNPDLPASFLGPGTDGPTQTSLFIPSTLPALPSQHTYRVTPVFSSREKDPRRIRELATEEGKLGEQALRKLAGAVKLEDTFHKEPPQVIAEAPRPRVDIRRKREAPSVETAFQETMRDLLAEEEDRNRDAFEVGPVVSSEKRFWRPDDGPVKRRLQGRTATLGMGNGKQHAAEPGGEGGLDFDFEI